MEETRQSYTQPLETASEAQRASSASNLAKKTFWKWTGADKRRLPQLGSDTPWALSARSVQKFCTEVVLYASSLYIPILNRVLLCTNNKFTM